MTNKILVIAVLFSALGLTSCSTDPIQEKPSAPEAQINFITLKHKYFVVGYDSENRIPKFVEYTLTKSDLNGPGDRKGLKFKPDPMLIGFNVFAVKDQDYTNSGYDRGHMAPAEDFSRSQEATEETFITTNAVPQVGKFNGGPWRVLETQVRDWACGEEKIRVITGPILDKPPLKLSTNIAVPSKLFKVVLDETPPVKAIGFIYSQTDIKGVKPSERIVPVEQIEREVGLKFFSNTDDKSLKPEIYNNIIISTWKSLKCK